MAASSGPRSERYIEVLPTQTDVPFHDCRVEALKLPRVMTHFTEDDLAVREFLANTSRAVVRKGKFRAA
jgi:hypothetical protein